MTGTSQDVAGSRKLTCARCRRELRWIPNRWPEGYICSTCHTWALETYGRCAGCSASRMTPGIAADGGIENANVKGAFQNDQQKRDRHSPMRPAPQQRPRKRHAFQVAEKKRRTHRQERATDIAHDKNKKREVHAGETILVHPDPGPNEEH